MFTTRDIKRCYLQKKIAVLFGYYIAFMNDIVALLNEKNFFTSICKWLVAWKRRFPRPKFWYENLSPSPSLSYTITKLQKRVFCGAKVIKGPEAQEVFIERAFFRFLSDRVLLRILRDRTFFESSVIGSFTGSSVIDSSLGSWMPFFRHVTIFYQNALLLLSLKADVLYYQGNYIVFFFNKTNSEKMRKCFHHRDTKYCIDNICYKFPDL